MEGGGGEVNDRGWPTDGGKREGGKEKEKGGREEGGSFVSEEEGLPHQKE